MALAKRVERMFRFKEQDGRFGVYSCAEGLPRWSLEDEIYLHPKTLGARFPLEIKVAITWKPAVGRPKK